MTSTELADALPNEDLAAQNAVENLNKVIAQFGPRAHVRDGQRTMVEHVARTIASTSRKAIVAGTGTGKSIGYLVPLVTSGKRGVIVVSSIALQDQLASKDLPFIEEALGSVSWAVLKGRTRYVCLQKATEAYEKVGQPSQSALFVTGEREPVDDEVAGQVRDVQSWMHGTDTGDLGELAFEPLPDTRQMVTATPEECVGRDKCPFGDECLSERAREQARAADIAVVNAHLFGADVKADGQILGPRDVVIVDEAHEAADILTRSFATTVSIRRLRKLAGHAARHVRANPGDDSASRAEQGPAPRVLEAVKELRALTDDRGDLVVAMDKQAGQIQRDWWQSSNSLKVPVEQVARAVNALTIALDDLVTHAGGSRSKAGAHIARTRQFALETATGLNEMAQDAGEETVWVEGNGYELVRVNVDISRVLHHKVWKGRAVVLTSATLPKEMARDLAVSRHVDVGSPFDHKAQSRLYVPVGLPEPKDPRWAEVAWGPMRQLITTAQGRTLALFTSLKNMNLFADRAEAELPYRILRQGQLPKQTLLDEFTEDEHSCLFASVSFFTGVDVPGSSCSLVILDKVPFPRPDEPLWVARREAAEAAHARAGKGKFEGFDVYRKTAHQQGVKRVNLPVSFGMVDVPRAGALMAQAAGRLVRSSECRGVVMILDPRLRGDPSNPKKWGYRHLLLDQIPAAAVGSEYDVNAFLGAAVGRHVDARP